MGTGVKAALIAIPAAVIVLVGGFFIVQSQMPSTSGDNPSVQAFLAKAACESVVESELVSPATAVYHHQVSGADPWRITGTVDSENAMGAMLRSSYSCTVERVDGELVATLNSIR